MVAYLQPQRFLVMMAICGLGSPIIKKSPSLPSFVHIFCDIPANPIAVVSDHGGRQPVSISELTTSCEQSIGSHGTSLRPFPHI